MYKRLNSHISLVPLNILVNFARINFSFNMAYHSTEQLYQPSYNQQMARYINRKSQQRSISSSQSPLHVSRSAYKLQNDHYNHNNNEQSLIALNNNQIIANSSNLQRNSRNNTNHQNYTYNSRNSNNTSNNNSNNNRFTSTSSIISQPSLYPESYQKYYEAFNLQNNDYSNNYIHTNGDLPTNYIRNVENPVDGYPKLQRLHDLKAENNKNAFPRPFGCRVDPDKMVQTLHSWINKHNLLFDTIMVGSLTENQFVLPILTQLPIDKLCSKPGFLYIWGSSHKMNELTNLLNRTTIANGNAAGGNSFANGGSGGTGNGQSIWSKKFRRSEELVFTTSDSSANHQPDQDDNSLFREKQWHCCMCITGTVRRAVDGHLINCNVNTDLKIQDDEETSNPSSVPDSLYKVAENFSSGNRRLHIIPSRTGYENPVKLRPGWVIMSPDVLLDNFDPEVFKKEIKQQGYNVPQHPEIELLRPKSPNQN